MRGGGARPILRGGETLKNGEKVPFFGKIFELGGGGGEPPPSPPPCVRACMYEKNIRWYVVCTMYMIYNSFKYVRMYSEYSTRHLL